MLYTLLSLQTWKIDEEVKIRMTESGAGARPAMTASQAFQNTLAKYGSANALHFKKDGEWYVAKEIN